MVHIEETMAMKPLAGSLSVLDDGMAEDARAYINNQLIGTVPFVKAPVDAGEYVVTIRKDGFLSLEKEYIVKIRPNEDSQLRVSMELIKDFYFKTEPPNAEIWMDGKLLGLSNDTFAIPVLYHSVMINKAGYASEKLNIFIDEKSPDNEGIFRELRIKYPLTIRNEGKGIYQLNIQGLDTLSNILIDNKNRISGQENLLPYGRYKLTLKDGKTVVYNGRHMHSSNYKPLITVPAYSGNSFRALTVDYVNPNNFEVSLGESQLFARTGLSTSILNMQYLYTGVQRSAGDIPEYTDTMAILIPSFFLLNWDFRAGGSIFRFLDICAIGRYKYSPGLKELGVNVKGCNDANAQTYFYGIELSSRLPYFNLNLKIGNQIIQGKSFYFDSNTGDYTGEKIPIRINWPILSFGMVIHGPIERTNNMLRLWKRPFLDEYLRAKFN